MVFVAPDLLYTGTSSGIVKVFDMQSASVQVKKKNSFNVGGDV
jgi:hypothetical protein